MPNSAFGGNLGQKINRSRVNLTSRGLRRDLPERFSVSVPPVANDICRRAVRNIYRNGVPARTPSRTTTPPPGAERSAGKNVSEVTCILCLIGRKTASPVNQSTCKAHLSHSCDTLTTYHTCTHDLVD